MPRAKKALVNPATATTPRIGRPSTYHPSYCNKVMDLGALGYSTYQISAEIDVPRWTMLRWADENVGDGLFRMALTRAKELEQRWWENRGQQGLEDRHFNAHLWIKTMQARFRQDYAEKVELTGEGGGPILFQTVYEEPPKTIDATYTATQKTPDPAE